MPLERPNNRTPQEKIKATEEVYKSCSRRLLRIAFGILKDRAKAEDIVSGAFAKLWEKDFDFGSHLGREIVERYLETTVRNDCKDELARSARQNIADRAWADAYSEDDGYVEREVVRAKTLDRMAELIKMLPPDLKDIWHLRYVQGKKPGEVAKTLGIPKKEVYVRIRRLKRVLGKQLGSGYIRLVLWLVLFQAVFK
jgi:RNA polymerase sigma factor (sigma-70 family)